MITTHINFPQLLINDKSMVVCALKCEPSLSGFIKCVVVHKGDSLIYEYGETTYLAAYDFRAFHGSVDIEDNIKITNT